MNIQQAKEQIERAVRAYLATDEFGEYVIPVERQRPILMIGAPGIGKTAIMEQIASELGIGIVSYSMTHHTRQSALGLPFIVHREYDGTEYDASEYTMSEIIASVYDLMENTGIKEGILFLDEINCVSETLSPSMLQFLQFKTFGRHKVPQGWVIVTAGNPPEYNKSVHEFDVATLDRVRRIIVEPDFDTWKAYGYRKGIHDAIMSFLELKKDRFYSVTRTIDGQQFVTARGWDDLSDMLILYEREGLPVDIDLVNQYVQQPEIAEEFVLYYEFYNRYKREYAVETILESGATPEIYKRAREALFDERLSLLSILLDSVTTSAREVLDEQETLLQLRDALRPIKARCQEGEELSSLLVSAIEGMKEDVERRQKAGSINTSQLRTARRVMQNLREYLSEANTQSGGESVEAFASIQGKYADRVSAMKTLAEKTKSHLSNLFTFVEEAFGDGQEMLVLITELTARYHCSQFISQFGCDEYFAHNADLLVYQRGENLSDRIAKLANALD